ncbi:MAG TPA: hypothetical protein DDZ41_03340 [Flavobacterium sp.]|nr:hypothetical protein [Flavobacterium sp.]
MIYTAFILGLMSSFHCIGMCGPIAMMLPIDRTNQTKKTFQVLLYHLGRLSAYASLGLLFGIIGKSFFIAGFQQQLSILMGIFMIFFALVPEKVFANYNFSKPVFRLLSFIKSSLGKQFKNKSYSSIFTIGLLNGYLPCGMVYAALFGAVAMQNVLVSIFYMVLFGLGTIPLMSAVVYLSNILNPATRKRIQKMIPVLIILIGMLFIVRGLGLDIPFLSPGNMSLFIQAEANCK